MANLSANLPESESKILEELSGKYTKHNKTKLLILLLSFISKDLKKFDDFCKGVKK